MIYVFSYTVFEVIGVFRNYVVLSKNKLSRRFGVF